MSYYSSVHFVITKLIGLQKSTFCFPLLSSSSSSSAAVGASVIALKTYCLVGKAL